MAFYPYTVTGVTPGDVPSGPDPITDTAFTSQSGILVGDRFVLSQQYAEMAWNNAVAYINQLAGMVYDIPWSAIVIPDVPGLDISPVEPGGITIESTDIVIPGFTAVPPDMPDVTTDIGDVPEFTATEPVFNIPDPPTTPFPIFTKEAPPLSEIAFPTDPDINLPTVPDITQVVVPAPPEFVMPQFEGELPVAPDDPPDTSFYWNEVEYSSELLDELTSKLIADVIAGGTGLNAETEQAIYDRATARQLTKTQEEYDKTLNYFASRGHTVPPGGLQGALVEISNMILQVETDLNNDILVQQSKLAQENTHFVIAQGVALEKHLMDRTNEVQNRAYAAEKYTTEYAIILYKVKVEAYIGQLEAYKVYAQVFEARIRAEITKAEFYRAQIEGLKLNVDLQRAAIEIYVAQVQGVQALINLYAAQMQAANIQANVDKTRIEGYVAEVQAFAAKSGAITEQYRAYQAQIAGEGEKARMYAAQAGAYEARVGGYKAKADVEIARVSVELQKVEGDIKVYLAAIEKYKSDIQAAVAQGELIATEQGLKTDVYKAETTQYAAEIDGAVKGYLGKIEETKAKVELQLKEAETSMRALIAQYELTQKALDTGSRVSSQLASSALSIVSASAHVGYGESRSDQRSYAAGWMARTGMTRSYSHDETKGIQERSWRETHTYFEPDAREAW